MAGGFATPCSTPTAWLFLTIQREIMSIKDNTQKYMRYLELTAKRTNSVAFTIPRRWWFHQSAPSNDMTLRSIRQSDVIRDLERIPVRIVKYIDLDFPWVLAKLNSPRLEMLLRCFKPRLDC